MDVTGHHNNNRLPNKSTNSSGREQKLTADSTHGRRSVSTTTDAYPQTSTTQKRNQTRGRQVLLKRMKSAYPSDSSSQDESLKVTPLAYHVFNRIPVRDPCHILRRRVLIHEVQEEHGLSFMLVTEPFHCHPESY